MHPEFKKQAENLCIKMIQKAKQTLAEIAEFPKEIIARYPQPGKIFEVMAKTAPEIIILMEERGPRWEYRFLELFEEAKTITDRLNVKMELSKVKKMPEGIVEAARIANLILNKQSDILEMNDSNRAYPYKSVEILQKIHKYRSQNLEVEVGGKLLKKADQPALKITLEERRRKTSNSYAYVA